MIDMLETKDAGLNELLAEMKGYGEANHIPIININGLKVLVEAVSEKRPHNVLEIGTAIGYSALYIVANSAPDVHITTLELSEERAAIARSYIDRSPYADRIDILVGDAGAKLLELASQPKATGKFNPSDTITNNDASAAGRVNMAANEGYKSADYIDGIVKNEKYDLVFIDAAKGQYPDYFRKLYPMLTEDAVIIADNVLFRDYVLGQTETPRRFRTIVKRLREYIKMVTEMPEFETIIYEKGDGLAVSKRKVR